MTGVTWNDQQKSNTSNHVVVVHCIKLFFYYPTCKFLTRIISIKKIEFSYPAKKNHLSAIWSHIIIRPFLAHSYMIHTPKLPLLNLFARYIFLGQEWQSNLKNDVFITDFNSVWMNLELIFEPFKLNVWYKYRYGPPSERKKNYFSV